MGPEHAHPEPMGRGHGAKGLFTLTTVTRRYSFELQCLLPPRSELDLLGWPRSYDLGSMSASEQRSLVGECISFVSLAVVLAPVLVHTPFPKLWLQGQDHDTTGMRPRKLFDPA